MISKIFSNWCVSARNSCSILMYFVLSFFGALSGKQVVPGNKGFTRVAFGSSVWRSSAYTSLPILSSTMMQPTVQMSIAPV